MKTIIITLILFICNNFAWSQKKNFSYQFYGFVRGDLFYNTRTSMAPVDGNFYLFPLDRSFDANGKDINAGPNGSFYTFTTRLGLNVIGPNIGKAKTSANIETDFGGFSKQVALLRIRKAYIAFDWEKHQLIVGQTWHPLFGMVFPDILNLSTGAPFQPFNRSPQFRYQYKDKRFTVTVSALWQLQYSSNGPKGMSCDYIKNSCVPELYLGADWYNENGWLFGAGAHLLSISPRKQSEWEGKIYKVNERMTTSSYEAHLKYKGRKIFLGVKSLLASSLDHTALIGGYGVTSIDPKNGKQEYTAFRHSTSWMNITYGDKWKPTLFVGYTKNLGTSKQLVSNKTIYGMGLDVDQLLTTSLGFSYNLPHWQFGFEGSVCTAWYGDLKKDNGKVDSTHNVKNFRVLGLMMYYF